MAISSGNVETGGAILAAASAKSPDNAELLQWPETAAVNIRNRSYLIAVEVNIDSEDASGVLFSHGARFGGHSADRLCELGM